MKDLSALRLRRADTVLAATVLGAAALSAVLLWRLPPAGRTVTVQQNGQTVTVLPLATDTDYIVTGVGGASNTVRIRDGRVSVCAASCPDGLCVRHRAVSRAGESIICLPNRVVVTVDGAADVDAEV